MPALKGLMGGFEFILYVCQPFITQVSGVMGQSLGGGGVDVNGVLLSCDVLRVDVA